ncbi:UNVERIFIED_CONTAM: hypothetical protein Slati_1143300 [Sesamum latifolium]|uniref:Zinc knuckle CX2CX4HX4C domain-containing protein n=1 Tax=Sesamum latifolium TaxID=2727402 RepID=A0AAW2XFN7_9LAMI
MCGMLGHVAKYCEEQFKEGFVDLGTYFSYGTWLRDPAQTRSRVLYGSIIRSPDSYRKPLSRNEGSKKGQAIFGKFGLKSDSLHLPDLDGKAQGMSMEEDATSKEPGIEQTTFKGKEGAVGRYQKLIVGGDPLSGDNMLSLDSPQSLEARLDANPGHQIEADNHDVHTNKRLSDNPSQHTSNQLVLF